MCTILGGAGPSTSIRDGALQLSINAPAARGLGQGSRENRKKGQEGKLVHACERERERVHEEMVCA
jgi:hypothetical protein